MAIEETKVGFASTTALENILKEAIVTTTSNGEYFGDPEYIRKYQDLKKYNSTKSSQ